MKRGDRQKERQRARQRGRVLCLSAFSFSSSNNYKMDLWSFACRHFFLPSSLSFHLSFLFLSYLFLFFVSYLFLFFSISQWTRKTKNLDGSSRPLARMSAGLHAPLTRLPYLLRSCAVHRCAHLFACSLTRSHLSSWESKSIDSWTS